LVSTQKTKAKKLLFSVGMKDLEMQTFSVGGPGGGGKDTSNSGVRLVHKASGARGEGRESRSNHQNKRAAFLHLIATTAFKAWHKAEIARRLGCGYEEGPDQLLLRVDEMIATGLKNGQIIEEVYEV
jgi:hypothetical protein